MPGEQLVASVARRRRETFEVVSTQSFGPDDLKGFECVEHRLAGGPPSPAVLTAADVMGYPSPIAMRRREHDSTERKGRTGSARL
jgi:hypothetical protein